MGGRLSLTLIIAHVMVKMDPLKLVPPGTNFLMNKGPQELVLCQIMDSLRIIWTTCNNVDPCIMELISLAKIWTTELLRPGSSAAHRGGEQGCEVADYRRDFFFSRQGVVP